jgi:diguanylate cyclase (GGDEF)-like protein
MSLLLSSILFGLAIFRYRILEILPIAHALTKLAEPLGAAIGEVYPGLDDVEIVDGLEREIEIKTDEGSRCFYLKVSAVVEEEIIGYVLVGLDITDRKVAELAHNRRAFFKIIHLERTRAKRQKEQLAILMVDVVHFKKINDTEGHDTGDKVLIELTARISTTLRETDLFARYGGEESNCLISGDKAGIMQTAERLRLVFLGKPIIFGEGEVAITVSIGVALLKDYDEHIEAAIGRADGALYESKSSGRNRVTLAESE